MGDWISEARSLMRQIAHDGDPVIPVQIMDCTVVSVDESSRTCIVSSEKNDIENMKVRLSPEICDGDIEIPSIDSSVLVVFSGITFPFITNTTWLDKKIITVGNQGYENDGSNQIFNDGSFGGLARVEEIAKKLNKIEKDINNLKNIFSIWVPVANDGGAALKTALSSYFTQLLVETQKTELENSSITHGEKI